MEIRIQEMTHDSAPAVPILAEWRPSFGDARCVAGNDSRDTFKTRGYEMQDQAKRAQAQKRGYGVVTALVLTSFIPLSLGLSCAGIFYPSVGAHLGVSTGAMGYYTSFLWLSAVLSLSFMGRMLQKFNARIVLSAVVALMALVFVWLSFTSSLWQFYAGGFGMGIGVGLLLFLAPSTLINRWFAERTGFLLGIVMAFTGIGGVVWSAVGGSLILQIGWAATYRVFAALCVLALFTTLLLMSNDPRSLGLAPVGYRAEASEGGAGQVAAPAGIPAAKAFRMPSFFLVLAIAFLLNFGMYVYFMIPSYVDTLELSAALPLLGATASSVAMAGQTVSKLVYGAAGDKFPHACVIVGIVMGIAGIVLLASGLQQAFAIYAAAFLFGAYYGVTNVMSPILTRRNFGDAEYPKIYACISTGAAVGNVSAALIMSALIDLTGGFDAMFISISVLLVVTILAVLAVKRKPATAPMEQ